MVALTFFLKQSVEPVTETFPDDCVVEVGRGDSDTLTVTRDGDTLRVDVPVASLSERHARVTVDRGVVRVEDLGSRSGTLLRVSPNTPTLLRGDAAWLGPDLAVRVEDGRWALPDALDALDADGLCRWLDASLSPRGLTVDLVDADPRGWRLEGDHRCLRVRHRSTGRTVGSDDHDWVRAVVNRWNARRDTRPSADGWRFAAASPLRARALDHARALAPTRLPVLLVGPPGAGKATLAQDLHDHGPRPDGPFIAVDLELIAPDARDAALFGHGDTPGLVESAHDGTLFLDEVSLLSPAAQVRLLRLLRDGVTARLDTAHPRPARVRVVASTAEDLLDDASGFRHDLYWHLSSLVVRVAPLEPADLDALARAALRARAGASALASPDVDVVLAELSARRWRSGARGLIDALDALVERRRLGDPWRDAWAAVLSALPSTSDPPGRPDRLPMPPNRAGDLLRDLLVLAEARHAPHRPTLARRLGMTFQGVDARLDALDVDPRDVSSLDRRADALVASLRAVLAASPDTRDALLRALDP
ncbi:MAG: sigma 54-interacting transcriptional regulator [Polyangiales bacterium]